MKDNLETIIRSACIKQLDSKLPKYCRNWKLILNLAPYIDTNGKKRYPTKTKKFKGTKTEAQEALDQFAEEYLTSLQLELSNKKDVFLFDLLDNFYILKREQEVLTKKSIERVKICYDNFKLNHENVPIQKVTRSSIDNALIGMKKGNTLSGKEAGANSLNKTKVYVGQAFEYALDNELLKKNPCKKVIHFKETKPNKKALTKEQFNSVLEQLDVQSGTQFGIMLCMFFGLRQSEVLNMQWKDISDSEIRVTKSKTDAGIRTLPIYPLAQKYIEERKKYLIGELKVTKNYFTKNMYVTSNSRTKNVYNGNRLSKWWQRNAKRLGVGDFTLHELRHTYATNLALSGASPIVMKELLGHSSSLVSLDIYTHVNNEELVEAQYKLQEVL